MEKEVDYKTRAGELLQQADLSPEDVVELLVVASVPLEDLPEEHLTRFAKELLQPQSEGGEVRVFNWHAVCQILERWLEENKPS